MFWSYLDLSFSPYTVAGGQQYVRAGRATAVIWRLLMVDEGRFRRLNRADLLPEVYERELKILCVPPHHATNCLREPRLGFVNLEMPTGKHL